MKLAVVLDVRRLVRQLMHAHAQTRGAFGQFLYVANRLVEPHGNQSFVVFDQPLFLAMDLRQVRLVA